jgi:hypothetical protein
MSKKPRIPAKPARDVQAEFSHYCIIRLNPLQQEEVRGYTENFKPLEVMKDIVDAGYKLSLQKGGAFDYKWSVLQTRADMPDAGIGVSAEAAHAEIGLVVLFYKLAIVAQWDLSTVPVDTPTDGEFR